MILSLTRFAFTDKTTIGQLDIDGGYFCWTLEDATRDGPKVPGETCIPLGVYAVTIDWSNRFQRQMPHLWNVPGFEGIRIHPGNDQTNTEGCILVGYSRAADKIWDSRKCFDDLFDRLSAAIVGSDPIYISISKGG